MSNHSNTSSPPDPFHSVSVLLLIENSHGLFNIWADLRDRYLGPLLHKIELDHSSVPVRVLAKDTGAGNLEHCPFNDLSAEQMTTFVLESLPPSPSQNRKPGVPRQYRTYHDGLQNLIASTRSPSGREARHLVIVAAAPPLADIPDETEPRHQSGARWYSLAEYLAKVPFENAFHGRYVPDQVTTHVINKADVRCHLIFKSGQDCKDLTNLFEEMVTWLLVPFGIPPPHSIPSSQLRLHKIPEEQPWFAIDMEKVIVRLSSLTDHAKIGEQKFVIPRSPSHSAGIIHMVSSTRSVLKNPDSAILPPVPATETPVGDSLELYAVSSPVTTVPTSPTPTPPQSPHEPFPSLVSQLQQVCSMFMSFGVAHFPQVHGLTKKKVYGSKPARKPFVSGELYRGDRKSLSLSPESSTPATPTTHGGKVPSPSTLERSLRRSQASPSDTRPYPKSRGSYDTATASFALPHTYNPASNRHNPPNSGSISLPPSPTPYPLTSRAPPEFLQPDTSWSTSPTTSVPFPPDRQERPGDYRQLPANPSHYASATYTHASHSSADDDFVSPTVPSLVHYPDGSVTPEATPQYQYRRHYGQYAPSPTSTYSENEVSTKDLAKLPWDPNVYRNELLSHLSGPTTTHYVPSTSSTYGSSLPGSYMKPRNSYLMANGQANDSAHESGPQVSDVWQSPEHLNGQYTSSQVATDAQHKQRTNTPPGSSSLTHWAG
ncbi:hypothetical protein PQX77_003983 [Marasmius sp. AFHP31]|nr:hypothetical protein PQX77_003983 [Marasmius sp. AFHP31]